MQGQEIQGNSWHLNSFVRMIHGFLISVPQCTKERPECTSCLRLNLQCNYSRKASRTPLTRSNLTVAEGRIRELETAFGTLFPGIDLETVLLSIQPGNPDKSTIENPTQSSNGPPPLPVQESHEP